MRVMSEDATAHQPPGLWQRSDVWIPTNSLDHTEILYSVCLNKEALSAKITIFGVWVGLQNFMQKWLPRIVENVIIMF